METAPERRNYKRRSYPALQLVIIDGMMTARFNTLAVALLKQEGERFFALTIEGDTIKLYPLELPKDTISVIRVSGGGRQGTFRSSFQRLSNLPQFKPDDVFEGRWDDFNGCLVFTKLSELTQLRDSYTKKIGRKRNEISNRSSR